MREAGAAYGKPPAVSREPAELLGYRPRIAASWCCPETADLKNNAIGVAKGVLMHALHVNPLPRAGDAMPALRAADRFFFFLVRLIFSVHALLSPSFRKRDAQAIAGIHAIYILVNHGTRQLSEIHSPQQPPRGHELGAEWLRALR